jgi:O-methyltransferase involved in polyketide biosynthesis
VQGLTGVSSTLILPLYARYLESQRPDAIINDPKTVEVMRKLQPNFTPPARFWMIQLEVAIRTQIIDEATQAFMKAHPGAAVINLGAGLCTRFFRLDDGQVRWLELDLPEVKAVRDQVFEETERHSFVTGSITDSSWQVQVEAIPGPKLFLAEGLLMYFPEETVRQILVGLSTKFPGSEMLLEVWSPGITRRLNRHPAVAGLGATLLWSLDSGEELERWGGGIRLLHEWFILERHTHRLGWRRVLTVFPRFRKMAKIIHIGFGG